MKPRAFLALSLILGLGFLLYIFFQKNPFAPDTSIEQSKQWFHVLESQNANVPDLQKALIESRSHAESKALLLKHSERFISHRDSEIRRAFYVSLFQFLPNDEGLSYFQKSIEDSSFEVRIVGHNWLFKTKNFDERLDFLENNLDFVVFLSVFFLANADEQTTLLSYLPKVSFPENRTYDMAQLLKAYSKNRPTLKTQITEIMGENHKLLNFF